MTDPATYTPPPASGAIPVQLRKPTMTNYAEFHNSDLYHIMKDDRHTVCSISVVAATDENNEYAETNYPLPNIVLTPSPSRTLCKECSAKTNKR
jgi:hypothetical protein